MFFESTELFVCVKNSQNEQIENRGWLHSHFRPESSPGQETNRKVLPVQFSLKVVKQRKHTGGMRYMPCRSHAPDWTIRSGWQNETNISLFWFDQDIIEPKCLLSPLLSQCYGAFSPNRSVSEKNLLSGKFTRSRRTEILIHWCLNQQLTTWC